MKVLLRFALLLLLLIGLGACGSLGINKSSDDRAKSSPPQFEHEILKDGSSASQPEAPQADNNSKSAEDVGKSDEQDELEAFVDEWYGTPHRMGGMTKKGVDCSGFVIIAYREVFNREFQGRRAEDIFSEMTPLRQDELEFGDLVFFKVRGRRIDHVGIYMGQGQFAHTSSSRGVMISNLSNAYWAKRFFRGARYSS